MVAIAKALRGTPPSSNIPFDRIGNDPVRKIFGGCTAFQLPQAVHPPFPACYREICPDTRYPTLCSIRSRSATMAMNSLLVGLALVTLMV